MLPRTVQMVDTLGMLMLGRDPCRCALCGAPREVHPHGVEGYQKTVYAAIKCCLNCTQVLMPGENTETLSTEKWTLPFQDPFPIPSWATSRKIDPKSGLVLDICSCGVSHPNEDWLAEFDPNNDFRLNEHPCCPRECCKIRSGRKKLRKKTRRST